MKFKLVLREEEYSPVKKGILMRGKIQVTKIGIFCKKANLYVTRASYYEQ